MSAPPWRPGLGRFVLGLVVDHFHGCCRSYIGLITCVRVLNWSAALLAHRDVISCVVFVLFCSALVLNSIFVSNWLIMHYVLWHIYATVFFHQESLGFVTTFRHNASCSCISVALQDVLKMQLIFWTASLHNIRADVVKVVVLAVEILCTASIVMNWWLDVSLNWGVNVSHHS